MSTRDSHSGSSRSRSRDHDSRPHRDRRDKDRDGDPHSSASRAQRNRNDRKGHSRSPAAAHQHRTNEYEHRSREQAERREVSPPAPPPPRISKITMGFAKPTGAPIKMTLGGNTAAVGAATSAVGKVAPSKKVAAVFNMSDDDEEEEMPAEARMRMRNIGRETPTSAGPNSFGKTKQGFCDSKKVFEKSMKQAMDAASGTGGQKPQPKFPQTIYKINNSL